MTTREAAERRPYEPKVPEPWSVKRYKQLERLERLLIECDTIDRANNVIDRLKRIIRQAQALRETDRDYRETSFLQFLKDQAIYDYHSRKRRKRTEDGK